MASVSLTIESIPTAAGGVRTRVTLSGPPAEVAELYRRLGTPGLPTNADGTTVVEIVGSALHPTVPTVPRA